MLRWRYPKSFLKLLLAGFAVAVLPLIVAFINANLAFERIASQGQQTVDNAVLATRAGQTLQSQLIIMERSLLQYQILHEPALMQSYRKAFEQTFVAARQLSALPQAPSPDLAEFRQELAKVDTDLAKDEQPADVTSMISARFAKLNTLSIRIAQDTNVQIDQASAALKEKAGKTQKKLLLQSLVLIPLALLSAAFIAFMLARPIRNMDDALERLGLGQYHQPIQIDGPGNLSKLGQRLDWLRTMLQGIDQQKQQFLRHVSHELKTPLTAIREGTELLHDGIGGRLTPQQIEITQILRENSLKLQKMIENLLHYTKLETMASSLQVELVDMRSIVQHTLQNHYLSIQKKSLVIRKFMEDTSWLVDREKIQIILDNLLSNAIKHTPDHGDIKIYVSENDHHYLLRVSDSGPGISLQDQSKLFRPFYRGIESGQSLVESSGLGLAICKNLVEAHGGTIQLSTHIDTQGATFVIKLPKKTTEIIPA
jgi:two-component system sensor histidine kinase GlrK